MAEEHSIRLRRLRIRSWRRGTKEMDMILGPFSDRSLERLDLAQLDDYEAMLTENDQDLYQWFSRQAPEPARYTAILSVIRSLHGVSGHTG